MNFTFTTNARLSAPHTTRARQIAHWRTLPQQAADWQPPGLAWHFFTQLWILFLVMCAF